MAPLLGLLLAIVVPVRGAVPQLLNYQGKLGDSSGNPVNGVYDMRFRLCADSACALPLYDEEWDSGSSQGVSVVNGNYTVQIGSYKTLPLSVFSSASLYLELALQPHGSGTTLSPSLCAAPCEILAPRERVVAAGFALHTLVDDELGPGATASYGVLVSTLVVAP